MSVESGRSLQPALRLCKHPDEHLDEQLAISLDCSAEILEDLRWAALQHGPSSEAWKALLKELREEERRTSELGRQIDARHDQRLEADPSMARLTVMGDTLINRLLAFSEDRP